MAAGTGGSAGTAGKSGSGGAGGAAGTAGERGQRGHRRATPGTGGAAGGTARPAAPVGPPARPDASGSVPAGYPTPTTANRAVCQSVAQTTSANGDLVCPGGGVGPSCIECLFGGSTYTTTDVATSQGTSEAGNYAVTVTLGGSAAGQTEIHAEANRVLLGLTSTSAGQSTTYSFAVNVRAKEGQPTENVAAGYPGLDLFFSGPTAGDLQISAIGYALVSAATKPVMIYVAGDSTVCDQTDTDYAGWAEMIPQYFAPPADVANYADSGESSASFLASGAEWGTVKNLMATGDWVLIQFGHNDKTTTSADLPGQHHADGEGRQGQGRHAGAGLAARARHLQRRRRSPTSRACTPPTCRRSPPPRTSPTSTSPRSRPPGTTRSARTAWQQYHALGTRHDPHQRRRRLEDRRLRRGGDQVAEHRPREVPAVAARRDWPRG